jgi:ActR/RegA family two-component response regulator
VDCCYSRCGFRDVLVVDDDVSLLRTVKRATREVSVVVAQCADEVWAQLDEHDVGFVIVDVFMPGLYGLDLVKQLRGSGRPLMIATMSGEMTVARARESIVAGADDFAEKPFSVEEVVARLAEAAIRLRKDAAPASLLRSRALADWDYIQAVLADCNGVVSAAARRLGITRQALQHHLRKPRPLS